VRGAASDLTGAPGSLRSVAVATDGPYPDAADGHQISRDTNCLLMKFVPKPLWDSDFWNQSSRLELSNLIGPYGSMAMEVFMPIILWLLGVPLVVVIALMITHVI
jgi:hypothetical protein